MSRFIPHPEEDEHYIVHAMTLIGLLSVVITVALYQRYSKSPRLKIAHQLRVSQTQPLRIGRVQANREPKPINEYPSTSDPNPLTTPVFGHDESDDVVCVTLPEISPPFPFSIRPDELEIARLQNILERTCTPDIHDRLFHHFNARKTMCQMLGKSTHPQQIFEEARALGLAMQTNPDLDLHLQNMFLDHFGSPQLYAALRGSLAITVNGQDGTNMYLGWCTDLVQSLYNYHRQHQPTNVEDIQFTAARIEQSLDYWLNAREIGTILRGGGFLAQQDKFQFIPVVSGYDSSFSKDDEDVSSIQREALGHFYLGKAILKTDADLTHPP
jgi:hypothetical protein